MKRLKYGWLLFKIQLQFIWTLTSYLVFGPPKDSKTRNQKADEIEKNVKLAEEAHPGDHELLQPLRDIANQYRGG